MKRNNASPDKNSSKKAKKAVQRFRPDYTTTWPYLTASKSSDSTVLCTICNEEFSCAYGGKNDCSRHINSKKHVNMVSLKKSNASISNFFIHNENAASTVALDIIKAETLMCEFLVHHNLPFSAADTLIKMYPRMFPDSKIASNMKCGRMKTTAIVKEMASMQMTDLATRMRNQPFSLATDGGNDADKKVFPVVVRIQNDSGAVNAELLSLPVCKSESATGKLAYILLSTFI